MAAGPAAGHRDVEVNALHVCCVTDGKPGHRSQLQGLVQALCARVPTQVQWLEPDTPASAATPPDLILAAGHRTHWRALRLKWSSRAPLVVLMKPSLPRWLFDLCVIPEHDGVPPSAKVLVTRGMLNDMQPAPAADPGRGLVLLGGPSAHYDWIDAQILEQLERLRTLLPAVRWQVTTSRRTPPALAQRLAALDTPNVTFTAFADTQPGWVREQLQRCGVAWVSEDSASMVYEALTAGARVGVLDVPRRGESRVSRGLDALRWAGLVCDLHTLAAGGAMPAPAQPLDEAGRVARYLVRWLRPSLEALDD